MSASLEELIKEIEKEIKPFDFDWLLRSDADGTCMANIYDGMNFYPVYEKTPQLALKAAFELFKRDWKQ